MAAKANAPVQICPWVRRTQGARIHVWYEPQRADNCIRTQTAQKKLSRSCFILYLSALQMKNSIVPAAPFPESLPSISGPSDVGPYESGYEGEGGEDQGADSGAKFRRYWAAIRRFRWIVIGLAAAGTIAGVVATRYVEPVYEARGAVWVSDVGTSGGAYRPPELLPNGAWVQLVKSFAVVDRVVATQRLFLKPKTWQDSLALSGLEPTRRTAAGQYTFVVDAAGTKYTLSETERGVVDRGALGDSVGRPVGFAWAPTAASLQGRHNVQFGVLQPRAVSVGLISRLDVAMEDRSNFITLTLAGADKWATADLLNVWMQQFVTTAADLRRRNMVGEASILETQRGTTASQLKDAEDALQSFRSGAITQPTEGPVAAAPGGVPGASTAPIGLASDYYRAQAEYQDVRRNRESLEQIIADARRGNLSADALVAVPAVAGSPDLGLAIKELVDKEAQLRALKQSYTDAFKPVKDLASSIQLLRTQTIPDLASTQVSILKKREAQIAGQVQANAADLRSIPARTIEEGRLRRNLATAEALYNNVENRYESAKLGAESTVPDVSILDPALPAANAQRNIKALLVIGGFAAAAALGILIALLLDLVDRRFRYPEQIADLGLQVVGAIPTVPKPEDASKDPEAMLQSVEAFRALRMNMHHAFDAPPVMVTITSPGPGDGKSMVASNLALSFAEAGFRTLLIDGDIRRGKLHSVFGLERRPGLLDYLAGDADITRVMRDVPVHGSLTLIPSGTRRHRGPELLTSARLTTLLDAVRPRFDVVLMDSAPLAAGVDAYALGVATQNMVLVMRTGHTDRRMAKAKLKLMRRLPVRIIGAVVNAVSASEAYGEYSYMYGYGPDADGDVTSIPEEVGVLRAPAEQQA